MNLVVGFRARGALDAAALGRSVQTLVDRHEVFRARFAIGADGAPVQRILPALAAELVRHDLAHLPVTGRPAEARRIVDAAWHEPIDLARGPLLRALLVRLDEGDHVVALVSHHIAMDGWSLEVLGRDLAEAYRAHAAGESPRLPPLRVDYGDYAAQQRAEAGSPEESRQLAWWRERLAGALPEQLLPTDRPRPAVKRGHGRRHERVLGPALARRVDALGAGTGASPFMVLLAALQLLLHRLAGVDDVVVGAPTSGRTRSELEPLCGCFLNLLALRTDLGGDPTVRELIARARETALGAYAHQGVPFERVVATVHPERVRSRAPIFQVLLNMHEFGHTLALPGLQTEPLGLVPDEALFDVTVYFRHLPEGIRLTASWETDLFDEPRIAELCAQLEHVLEQMVGAPDRRIGSVSLVTPGARAVLPDPEAPLDTAWHGPVHERVTAWARCAPGRTAVEAGGERWSYADLDAASNRLAHALRAGGIGADDVVAVWAHRAPGVVVAMLGALKAGAALTMLDPAYPEARLAECVGQARPLGWIEVDGAPPLGPRLARAARAARWWGRVGPGLAAAARVGADPGAQPATPPGVAVGPESLALVMFTSGSTGRPKGVLGRHGPLSHFLPWMAERFELGPGDRFSLLSGLAHDPLQRDVFTALWVGGAICVPVVARGHEPGALAAWLADAAVTVAHLTPAMIDVITSGAAQAAGAAGRLRLALVVGEALRVAAVDRLRGLAPALTVVNLYGSTETQRAVAHLPLAPPDPGAADDGCADPAAGRRDPVPLGRGMPGAQLLVLTAGGALAGVGELGEIHLRSPHLARGYLDDPELTAARFLPDPAGGTHRRYRTGDLGRFLPDGSVEFAGRRDTQVKIRSFRVELGEVEAALAAHPSVRQAAVTAIGAEADRALVAYVVTDGEVPVAALRRHVRERLPDYMVPSRWVALGRLPLTPNGKVDRAALPAPRSADGEPRRRVRPRSPLEHQLALVFASVLGVPEVGATDSFFDLGGHSLLAVRLLHEIDRAVGRRLPLAALYDGASVRDVAAALLAREAPTLRTRLMAVRTGGARTPFVLLHGDFNGGGFYCLPLGRAMGEERPVYVLHPHGLDGGAVPATIEAMAADHLEALRAARPRGPYVLGGHCNGALVAFEMARRLVAGGERVDLVVMLDPPMLRRPLERVWALAGRRAAPRGPGAPGSVPRALRLRPLIRAARDTLAALARGGLAPHRSPFLPAPATTLGEAYGRAIAAFSPRPYRGRVVVLRAAEEPGGAPDLGWRWAAPWLRVEAVPGDHLTCLTTHVDALAARVRALLDGAPAV